MIPIARPTTVHSGRVWDVFSSLGLHPSVLHAASLIVRVVRAAVPRRLLVTAAAQVVTTRRVARPLRKKGQP